MLESFAKRAAQDGKKDLAFEHPRRWMPIDVEVRCISGIRAVLEHVHPPGVFAAGRHVIRHNIQNQSQLALAKLVLKNGEVCLGPQLWVETRWVRHVIAVSAAAPAAKNRRSIYVRYAKFRKIVDDFRGVLKREVLVELQSVGGGNKCFGRRRHRSSQNGLQT